jgi:ubiquitin-conjugating enzyme E2 Q
MNVSRNNQMHVQEESPVLSSNEASPAYFRSQQREAAVVVVHDAVVSSTNPSPHSSQPTSSMMQADSTVNLESPAEMIPPEGDEKGVSFDLENVENEQEELEEKDKSDDESEYSYEDDEDGDYDGFLVSTEGYDNSNDNKTAVVEEHSGSNNKGNSIVADRIKNQNIVEDDSLNISSEDQEVVQFASLDTIASANNNEASGGELKAKWKEPTKQAVNMSLRVGKEKSGGRRRLAADLYKVMMTDTEESGFSVEQSAEESMDKWTIKLFKFDEDSDLHKDLLVLGLDCVELEMNFPEQYPFEPPFVRVVRPRFKKQTGFVMNGALCMELLTNEGWNPINDIESVIVSIRSLLTIGDGRLEAAANMPEEKRKELLAAALQKSQEEKNDISGFKRKRSESEDDDKDTTLKSNDATNAYTAAEAKAAYKHLSDYHKKKGWSGWWAKKG